MKTNEKSDSKGKGIVKDMNGPSDKEKDQKAQTKGGKADTTKSGKTK